MLDYRTPEGEEICLPDGYSPYNWRQKQLDNPSTDDVSANVRWLNHTVSFVLDESDQGYLSFMDKCRKDTNDLKRELETEFNKRSLPVTVKHAGGKRKMAFIIRGPFLASNDPNKKETRMQGKVVERDNFILHFDAKQKFQMARFWKPEVGDRENTHYLRIDIVNELANIKPFLNENYGNWPLVANRIVDIIQEALKKLES